MILSGGIIVFFYCSRDTTDKQLKLLEGVEIGIYIENIQKADDKNFVCTFSKNVKSKLYHIPFGEITTYLLDQR